VISEDQRFIGAKPMCPHCGTAVLKGRTSDMATFLNVGRTDRALRLAMGAGLGIAGILVNGHP